VPIQDLVREIGKVKTKINATRFVNDLRSGMDVEELMSLHGLNRIGLDRLLKVLVEKNMLHSSEVASMSSGLHSTPEALPRQDLSNTSVRTDTSRPRMKAQHVDASACPQCGAEVSGRSLTCPECGHVLPGQKRWEDVDPKVPLLDRVPPWILGCILALPILVATIYVWKNIIVPMTEAKMEKKAAARKKSSRPLGMTLQPRKKIVLTNPNAEALLQKELDRLIAEDILAEVEEDGTVMTAGSAWMDLTKPEKETLVRRLRQALVESGHNGRFVVMDLWGNTLVTAQGSSIVIHEALESEKSAGPEFREKTTTKAPPRKKTSEQFQKQGKTERPRSKAPQTRTRRETPRAR
jgi:hypothetical protein